MAVTYKFLEHIQKQYKYLQLLTVTSKTLLLMFFSSHCINQMSPHFTYLNQN